MITMKKTLVRNYDYTLFHQILFKNTNYYVETYQKQNRVRDLFQKKIRKKIFYYKTRLNDVELELCDK